MKHSSFSRTLVAAFFPVTVFGAMTVLAGCPVFDDHGDGCDDGGCWTPSTSGAGGSNTTSGTGGSQGCTSPSDCLTNQTCGDDNQCHDGDCTFWGCPSGYACQIADDGTASCEPGTSSTSSGVGGSGGATTTTTTTTSSTGGAGGATSTTTSSSGGAGGGSNVIYCGNPKDCAAGSVCASDGTCHAGACSDAGNDCIYGYTCQGDGTCASSNPNACGSDADCANAGSGYACVSGVCTAPDDQCFDQAQCGASDKCAAGKCTPECTQDSDCTGGYTCDTTKGICSNAAKSCTITNDCGGPTEVCVDGACVPRSNGGSCASGDDWVENGCIPSQKASFLCNTDGMLGDGQPGDCANGSICLHHGCYISCDAPNQSACDNQPTLDECKPVMSSSGTYSVCGSSDNLGGECDPTATDTCTSGEICIDGFCK